MSRIIKPEYFLPISSLMSPQMWSTVRVLPVRLPSSQRRLAPWLCALFVALPSVLYVKRLTMGQRTVRARGRDAPEQRVSSPWQIYQQHKVGC